MSWLYTVVFAGLMFSSGDAPVSYLGPSALDEQAPAGEVVKDETEKFEQTYPLNAGGRVNVENVNGNITVEAWDRSEIRLEYTKTADTKEHLADVEVRVESKPEYFSVETDYSNLKNRERWRNGGNLNVQIKIMAPRGAILNEIETVNGSVAVSNFTNVTRVSAVNGSVNASNLRGTAKLSTVNGEVTADFDRLEAGSRINLDTVNGRANLVIPSDANATVRADSLNGNITNDFGLPVRKGKYVGRDLYGRLGNGDVQIRLNSVNGGLSIGRKNDGKTPSPATNLLPQKEKDDKDWDYDEKADIDIEEAKSAKINKATTKAIKDSVKASSRATTDVATAIDLIGPEIAKVNAESMKIANEVLRTNAVQSQIRAAQSANMSNAFYFPTVPRVESKSNSFPVKGVPKVTIIAKGCSVTVRGWDKSEVQYSVTQFSDPRNRTPIALTDSHTDSAINIKVENPSYEARSGTFFDEARRVRIEVFVPRRSNLKIDANGGTRIEGVSGTMELAGADEPINVRDSEGNLRIASADGRVRVIGFKGEVDSTTGDGDVYLEGNFTKLTGRAVDGNFYLTVPEEANADVSANVEELVVEDLRIPSPVGEGRWRFGKGGPKYTFSVNDGQVFIRSEKSLVK